MGRDYHETDRIWDSARRSRLNQRNHRPLQPGCYACHVCASTCFMCMIISFGVSNDLFSAGSCVVVRGYSSMNCRASASKTPCCCMTVLNMFTSPSHTWKCFVGDTKTSLIRLPSLHTRPN